MDNKHLKRIEYIDAMRGFTMILVVFSHILLFSYGFNSDAFTYNDIFRKFRMPLFFFISGWVLYKADRIWDFDYIKSFLKNKIRVQIFSTTVFFLLYAYLFNYSISGGLLATKLGYWFTFDLFCFFCFYILSFLIIPKRVTGVMEDMIVMLVMTIVMILSFSHNIFDKTEVGWAVFRYFSMEKWRYYIFFIMGTFVKKYFNSFVSLTDNKYFMSFIIISFVFLLCVDNKLETPIMEKVLFIVYGILGIIIVFTFFRRYESSFSKERKIGQALQYIGRRTLDIYFIHYFIVPRGLHEIGSFFDSSSNYSLEFFITLIFSLLVISICLVISSVIRLSPALSYYLLGVKNS